MFKLTNRNNGEDTLLNKETSSNKKEDGNEEKKYKYQLYFDGASRGNPGISGSGAVLYKCYQDKKTKIFEVFRFVGVNHTNNQAEYCGLIIGLKECLKRGFLNITVYGDSEVIIKQMNEEYNVNSDKLKPLYQTAKKIENKMGLVSFQHIKRVFNSDADALANKAIINYISQMRRDNTRN
tara:strand:+ start:112 stop:651 length:540 start_codon:yes stop_codon:yes gene_type:complete